MPRDEPLWRPPSAHRSPGLRPHARLASRAAPARPAAGASPFAAPRSTEQPEGPRAPASAASRRASGRARAPLPGGPFWACSLRIREPGSPGARITSPGFRGCRGGAEKGWMEDSQRLVPRPLPRPGCGRPRRKMQANQGPGAGLKPSRPPSGLIESYIKKFSSERREKRGGRSEGQRRRESGRACETGRSAVESLKHGRNN